MSNFNEKHKEISSYEESESDSETHQLARKSSSMNQTQKYVRKIRVKGQSEYQIALRKKFVGAKGNIEKVRQL